MPAPDFVNVEVPDTAPEIVPVIPVGTCTVDAADNATVPDNVPADEKFTTPADDTPAPAIVNGSADETAAATSRVAPSETTVPCPLAEPPSDDTASTFTVPPDDTVVTPLKLLAEDGFNDNVDAPVCFNSP